MSDTKSPRFVLDNQGFGTVCFVAAHLGFPFRFNSMCYTALIFFSPVDLILGTSDPYVKFKLEGKQLYKSKVVYKSLHPRWNESFSYPLRDREHVIDLRVGILCPKHKCSFDQEKQSGCQSFTLVNQLQVYNKNLTADEFMGCSSICLKNLDLYR